MFNELFAKYLDENNIVKDGLETYLKQANEENSFLYNVLINNDILRESECFFHLADFLGMDFKDIQLTELNFEAIKRLPREKMILNNCVPYAENDKEIYFATSDPSKINEIVEFKYFINKRFVFSLVTTSKMGDIIAYVNNRIKQINVLQTFDSEEVISNDTLTDTSENAAPIITLVDSILRDATSRGASDIHIEPFEKEIRVRYRIDGKLVVIDRIKPNLFQPLLARFKIISEMNIAERRVPQDGKISLEINGSDYDFRVSTMPTVFGEKIVIRIYNRSLSTDDMSVLGLTPGQRELITTLISRPHGIILITGPTGSGKSTSLYTFLRYLNKNDTNITTVEDPVENVIPGITQVQINSKANLTFSAVLRATLRQDPNIIMIGEIRDEETAHIAIRAAITGHLVLSTIHTNSSAAVVSRLIDMGIAPYLVADSLLCSISQRLLRKLCPHCKQEATTTTLEMNLLGLSEPKKIFRPRGCTVCSNTGYSGRIGVFEILPINSKIRNVIMSEYYTSETLQETIKDEFETIVDVAKNRVLNGDTSIEEYTSLIAELENKVALEN